MVFRLRRCFSSISNDPFKSLKLKKFLYSKENYVTVFESMQSIKTIHIGLGFFSIVSALNAYYYLAEKDSFEFSKASKFGFLLGMGAGLFLGFKTMKVSNRLVQTLSYNRSDSMIKLKTFNVFGKKSEYEIPVSDLSYDRKCLLALWRFNTNSNGKFYIQIDSNKLNQEELIEELDQVVEGLIDGKIPELNSRF